MKPFDTDKMLWLFTPHGDCLLYTSDAADE